MIGRERDNEVIVEERIDAAVSRGPKHEWLLNGWTVKITKSYDRALVNRLRGH